MTVLHYVQVEVVDGADAF